MLYSVFVFKNQNIISHHLLYTLVYSTKSNKIILNYILINFFKKYTLVFLILKC
jgi:hypothetical protein